MVKAVTIQLYLTKTKKLFYPAIIQAVACRVLNSEAGVCSQYIHLGFVVNWLALELVPRLQSVLSHSTSFVYGE